MMRGRLGSFLVPIAQTMNSMTLMMTRIGLVKVVKVAANLKQQSGQRILLGTEALRT